MSDYDTTVARTILVVRDLDVRPGGEGRAGLPRLAALEQWLARGDVQATPGGWRQWLQRELADPGIAALPPASIAAAAVPEASGDGPVWFAAPVHLVAGLDTVRLHPAGLLRLAPDEERALARDFARDFADSGWSLHATGRGELLLAGAGAGPATVQGQVRTDDPVCWLGADPRQGLPSGPGAAPLRRLGAELEMWLHGHPVNEARAARGQLTANALWLWGGGAAPVRGAAAADDPRALASAEDLFMDGLARCLGWQAGVAPSAWPPPRTEDPAPRLLVVTARTGAPPDIGVLESLERDWIAPALADWRRSPDEFTLLTASLAVTLPRRSLLRAWRALRRPRPWWQALAAC